MTDPIVRNLNEPTCGIYNKLFFTAMDTQMPASAPIWDQATGATVTEWLHPPVMGPVVTNLTYAASGSNALSGNFTFNISDYVGNGSLQLDLDNDGIYGGTNDRSLPFSLSSSSGVSVFFDGLGANGTPLAAGSQIRAKVLIDRTGEVHFTMVDVEGLVGVKLTRTTGDVTGASTLYWNDTQLDETGKHTITPIKDGSAGVDSNTANGVHGWAGQGNNLWGNGTLIDNWAYVGVAATQEILIEGCNANAGTIRR